MYYSVCISFLTYLYAWHTVVLCVKQWRSSVTNVFVLFSSCHIQKPKHMPVICPRKDLNLSKSTVRCRPLICVRWHNERGEHLVCRLPYFQFNVDVWTPKATGILSHIPVENVEKHLIVYSCCIERYNPCQNRFTMRITRKSVLTWHCKVRVPFL